MSDIKFACPQCQQHIQCEPGYAGMEIACPTCSTRIIVPGPAPAPVPAMASAHAPASAAAPPMPSRLATAPASAAAGCPSCGAALPRGAVLCTRCGYNLATGQRTVAGRPAPKGKAMAPSGDTVWYKTVYPYVGLLAVFFLVLTLLARQNDTMKMVLALCALLYLLVVKIMVVVAAFKDSAGKGILCFCIDIYAIYWVFKESESPTLKVMYGLALALWLFVKFGMEE